MLIDPARLSDDERAARDIRRLPGTLAEALDRLEENAVLTEALGPLLTRSFLAVKRARVGVVQQAGRRLRGEAPLLEVLR